MLSSLVLVVFDSRCQCRSLLTFPVAPSGVWISDRCKQLGVKSLPGWPKLNLRRLGLLGLCLSRRGNRSLEYCKQFILEREMSQNNVKLIATRIACDRKYVNGPNISTLHSIRKPSKSALLVPHSIRKPPTKSPSDYPSLFLSLRQVAVS